MEQQIGRGEDRNPAFPNFALCAFTSVPAKAADSEPSPACIHQLMNTNFQLRELWSELALALSCQSDPLPLVSEASVALLALQQCGGSFP